jgi:hypothetical protein
MNRVILDGLSLHLAAGTLATLDATQAFPISAITIDPLVPKLVAVQILCPLHITTVRDYSVGIAWALQAFYPDAGVIPQPTELVGGLIRTVDILVM